MERLAVLVVEDEPSLRLLCRINLELEGFDVVEAATLAEARAALASCAPSVVLLDLRIGSESGADLIGELHNRTPPVPVALVSGSVGLGPTAEGLADAYLQKPYSIEDLVSTVKSLVAR
ncbi:MAG: response regulator [Acidobacteriota bacterium]|nr:response regulator [Acidobacteriota bacterium]